MTQKTAVVEKVLFTLMTRGKEPVLATLNIPFQKSADDDYHSDLLLLLHFTGKVPQAALSLLVFERIFHVASTGIYYSEK